MTNRRLTERTEVYPSRYLTEQTED